MVRSAVSTGARSTGGCAEHCWLRGAPSDAFPPHPTVLEATTGAGRTPRRTPGAGRRRSVADDSHAALRAGCLYAGSGDTTRVRGSCRGFRAQDGAVAPVQWGKTPVREANPRPEDHDGHLSEEASPVSWAHSWAHTGDTPAPHSRTRGGVADVRQGCGRSPGARRQPRGTSTPLRHVHNETSPSRRFGDLSEPRPPADEEREEPRPIRAGAPSAPASGLEPLTVRLTVGCSAIELRGKGAERG